MSEGATTTPDGLSAVPPKPQSESRELTPASSLIRSHTAWQVHGHVIQTMKKDAEVLAGESSASTWCGGREWSLAGPWF